MVSNVCRFAWSYKILFIKEYGNVPIHGTYKCWQLQPDYSTLKLVMNLYSVNLQTWLVTYRYVKYVHVKCLDIRTALGKQAHMLVWFTIDPSLTYGIHVIADKCYIWSRLGSWTRSIHHPSFHAYISVKCQEDVKRNLVLFSYFEFLTPPPPPFPLNTKLQKQLMAFIWGGRELRVAFSIPFYHAGVSHTLNSISCNTLGEIYYCSYTKT